MSLSDGRIIEVDHLMTRVDSLVLASQTYERLGFTLTPESPIAAMGLANRLIVFGTSTQGAASFVELMALVEPKLAPGAMKDVLAGAPGPKCAVLSTLDAVACREALAGRGWEFEPVVQVRREWRLPGEPSVWPRFDVLLPRPSDLPVSICRYHNAELYQRDNWRGHPNTAETLQAILVLAVRPLETANKFGTMTDCKVREDNGDAIVAPGRTELRIRSRDKALAQGGELPLANLPATRYLGFRVGVRDATVAAAHLTAHGVLFQRADGRLLVGPSEACGNYVEFMQL